MLADNIDSASFNRKVRIVEWTMLAFALLLISVVFLVPAYQERNATVARETERLQHAAQVVEQSLSRSLDSTDRAIRSVCADLPVWRSTSHDWTQASRRLKAYSDAMPSVRSMLVIDAHGDIVAQGAIDAVHLPKNVNVASSAYFQTVLAHPDRDTLYVSAPFISRAGAWTYNLSRAVFAPDGTFDGMVVAAVNLEEYKLLLASTRSIDDQFIAIIHGKGLQIIVDPEGVNPQGMNVAVPGTFFTRHLESGRSISVMTGNSPAAKTKRIVAIRTLQPPALHMNEPIVILAGRDEDGMLRSWRDMKNGRISMLVIIWSLGIAGLWGWQRSRIRAVAQIQINARQVSHIFDSKISLLVILDHSGRCLRMSAAWGELLGWKIDDLIGQKIMSIYTHPDDLIIVKSVQSRLESGEQIEDMIYRIRDAHGVYHDIMGRIDVAGGLTYIDARDVTIENQDKRALTRLNQQLLDSNAQLRDKEILLLQMAQTDGLTKLANRRRFDEEFRRQWLQCTRDRQPLAVILIDIDHFKRFNDHYGHLAGDACLQKAASAMHSCMKRPSDLLARYGGEEFVVLLPDTAAAGALKVAERLRKAVSDLAMTHANSLTAAHVTVSIGVSAVTPTEAASAEAVLRAADEALYQAKARGRNRVCGGEAETPQAEA